MSSLLGPMVGRREGAWVLVCFLLRFPQTALRALTSAGEEASERAKAATKVAKRNKKV